MDTLKLFHYIPENLIAVSPDYKIIDATNAYLKVTLKKREEIQGRHFLLEAYPDPNYTFEANPVRLSFEKVLQTKAVDYMNLVSYRIAVPESEGGGFYDSYWEASHTPVLDDNGNIEYIIQKTTDVTERELAKQAQKVSEGKFKFLTDAVPQLIHTAEPNGSCTYVNQRWVEYTGVPLEELLGPKWQQVIHPDDITQILNRQKEAIYAETEFQAELRIKNKDGNYRWHLVRSLPMKDEQGQVIMRVGSSYDIHSTKQMVQELLEANEQMSALSDQVQLAYQKAEDQRLTLERLIMQAPAIFAILKGPEHRYELVNPQYQRLLPNRELIGRTVAEAVPEVVDQGFVQILDNVFKTREPFIASEIGVKLDWYNTGQLEEAFFTTTYQPLVENNEVTGIIAFGYEVTEKVKLRQELDKLKSGK
ncbi:PAS domain-containing protein [Adhaeribacter aquaticus]|uniref:PAS domain-containing protein n=1 Tax=Adhaeribacter aquaticus TaxID=299567 RepID=UPI0003FEDFE5|nr:PAS domain-containing protein [Adhaeribacter aquaticus]